MLRFSFCSNALLWSVALLAGIAGCGRNTGDGYSGDRGQVSGKVTVDGQPLANGCQIIFMSSTGGYTASGVITDGGSYKLVYPDAGGLPAVEYMVQFTAPVTPDTAAPVDPSQMAAKMKLGPKAKADADATGPFPLKYASTHTSGLTYKVEAGENTKDFALEAK